MRLPVYKKLIDQSDNHINQSILQCLHVLLYSDFLVGVPNDRNTAGTVRVLDWSHWFHKSTSVAGLTGSTGSLVPLVHWFHWFYWVNGPLVSLFHSSTGVGGHWLNWLTGSTGFTGSLVPLVLLGH